MSFDRNRWMRDVVSLSGLVYRMSLFALGALFEGDRAATSEQLSRALNLPEDVVADALAEAVTAGIVTQTGRGYLPVQTVIERDRDDDAPALALSTAGIEIDCATCGVAADQPCVTVAGKPAWSSHLPRRKYADTVATDTEPVAA